MLKLVDTFRSLHTYQSETLEVCCFRALNNAETHILERLPVVENATYTISCEMQLTKLFIALEWVNDVLSPEL